MYAAMAAARTAGTAAPSAVAAPVATSALAASLRPRDLAAAAAAAVLAGNIVSVNLSPQMGRKEFASFTLKGVTYKRDDCFELAEKDSAAGATNSKRVGRIVQVYWNAYGQGLIDYVPFITPSETHLLDAESRHSHELFWQVEIMRTCGVLEVMPCAVVASLKEWREKTEAAAGGLAVYFMNQLVDETRTMLSPWEEIIFGEEITQ